MIGGQGVTEFAAEVQREVNAAAATAASASTRSRARTEETG